MALPAPAAPAAFDVVCNTKELKQALDLCASVVERRNSLPILTHVLLETGDSRLLLRATDLEVSVSCRLPVAVHGVGATTVDVRRLQKVLKGIKAASVQLMVEKDRLVIQGEGGGRVELLTMDPKEFPSPPAPKSAPTTIEFDAGVLATLLRKVDIAVSSDETRLSMNGVFFERLDPKGKDATLRLVATDGHRLAMVDWPLKEGIELPKNPIVPKKAVGLLMKLDALKARKGEPRGRVTFQVHPPKGTDTTLVSASVPIGDCSTALASLTTRCIEGDFPDYRQVIPKKKMPHRATLKREEWLGALRRLKPLLGECCHGVKLLLTQKDLELVAQNPDTGVSTERVAVEYKGIGVSTGFNATYLIDALSVGEGDEVLLELSDEVSPCRVTFPDAPTYCVVIMPMRL